MYSIKNRSFALIIVLLLFSLPCEANDDQQPPPIGNFALPSSQQPGPLVSFGQNIIDKNETQLSFSTSNSVGVNQHFTDLFASILYGITDRFSIFIHIPYAASYRIEQMRSAGLEDTAVQLEYAFYEKSTSRYGDQATIVGNFTIPTGSSQKNPATGNGSASYFMGATFNRTYVDWLMFASSGAIVTTVHDNEKFGNNYLYQFGFGRNIKSIDGWMFAGIAEIDGNYSERDRIGGVTDENSGGNLVYVVPSLWVSNKNFIFQAGIGLPILQNLYGGQAREKYLMVASLAWSIY